MERSVAACRLRVAAIRSGLFFIADLTVDKHIRRLLLVRRVSFSSLEIIQSALQDADAGLEDIVCTRVMLKRIEDWAAVAGAHGEYFKDFRPASTMVQVLGFIDPAWLVEIEADAIIGVGAVKTTGVD
jgi:hypothetical protein